MIGLLRQFIQKTNADADVDRVLTEMEKYAKGNPKLLKQACDGLTRVIAVNYGTPYAQMAGRAFIGLRCASARFFRLGFCPVEIKRTISSLFKSI